MKTVLYLIQAAGGLPEIYECLKTRSYLLLSYKEETSDTTIYAPNTTWTEGRNRLYQYVKDNHLLYDYYVFMDEDIVFKKTNSILIPGLSSSEHDLLHRAYGNISDDSLLSGWPLKTLVCSHSYQAEEQEAGFASLEESLKLGYSIVAMSLYGFYVSNTENNQNSKPNNEQSKYLAKLPEKYKEVINVENLSWPFQTIDGVDGILNALSQEVFFANTVLPFTEKYDEVSWWLSNVIFCTKANHYHLDQMMQNNQYTILNTQHNNYPQLIGSSSYLKTLCQIYAEICAEAGVDEIQFSESKEIKPSVPLKQVEGRFMSRFGFFVKVISPAIIFSCINDRGRVVYYIKVYTKKLLRLILPGMLFTRMMKIRQSFKKMRHRQ